MTKEDWIKEQQEDDDFMFRLGNISKRNSGLPMMVWIDVKDSKGKNSPRLIFTDSYSKNGEANLIPISIDKENPEILLENVSLTLSQHAIYILKKWIIENYDGLMDVWNGNISHCEFITSVVKRYHLANGIERVFERIDYDYATIRNSSCTHRYEFYVQGFLDGMRFMNWWKTQNPDKELFEKILSLNMYKETEEMYEEIDEYNHPLNIYTFGVIKYKDTLYRLSTQGDTDKIPEPCFHIYKEDDDDYNHPEFDFAVSLIDILSKNEFNLIWQEDNESGIRRSDKTDCSWSGYEDLLSMVKDYLSLTPESNKRWVFNDNLDRAIYAWNNETRPDFGEKGINPLKEYCESHNIPIMEKYKPYLEK